MLVTSSTRQDCSDVVKNSCIKARQDNVSIMVNNIIRSGR
jgi:hypothetical protein